MPVRLLTRDQTWLLPPTLDELIHADHSARCVAAVVDNLDPAVWAEMGIDLAGEALGAPGYHARALLSVWLYGFMTGPQSSRKLEVACRENMAYLWLTGWQHPDHNTLWRFYKAHRDEMRKLFKRTVRVAVQAGLVDLAVQAVDGTKIAANAAKDRTYDKAGLAKLMERVDKRILDLKKENEEAQDAPPPRLPKKLEKAEHLREKVKAAMEELERSGQERINLTDKEAPLMKSREGIKPCYNEQAVVSPMKLADEKVKGLLITAADVVDDPSDMDQLVPMLDQADENKGKPSEASAADAGYHSGANLAGCAAQGRVIVMPESQDRRLKLPYHKDKFSYDEMTDTYTCPMGQPLAFRRVKQTRGTEVREYRGSPGQCRLCAAFGKCTKNERHGRTIEIGPNDELLREHRKWMATEEAKALYDNRKELPEPVFGIIKQGMGIRRFLLRGLHNVKSEGILIATAFNLKSLWKFWVAGALKLPERQSAMALSGPSDSSTRTTTSKHAPEEMDSSGMSCIVGAIQPTFYYHGVCCGTDTEAGTRATVAGTTIRRLPIIDEPAFHGWTKGPFPAIESLFSVPSTRPCNVWGTP